MKKFAALFAGLLIALSGCTNYSSPAGDGNEEVVEASTPEESVEPDEAAESEESEEEEEDQDIDPRLLEDRDPIEERINDNGNLPMPENSPFYLVTLDLSTVLAEIDTSDVNTNVQCTSEYAPPAEGHLVSVDFNVTAEPELRDDPYGFWITSDLFQILDHDGQIVDRDPGSTVAAYSCPSEADQFPFGDIRPGTSGSGAIVLESSIESGIITFHELSTETYFEWEFNVSSD